MPFDILRQIVVMGLLSLAVCFELDRSKAWSTLEKLGVFADMRATDDVMSHGNEVAKVYLASFVGAAGALLAVLWLTWAARP